MKENTTPEHTSQVEPLSQESQAGEQATQEKLSNVALNDQLSSANDKYMRLYAEFDNFKRRTSRDRLSLLENANKALLAKLLPVIDDFERALPTLALEGMQAKASQEGINLIYEKLIQLLHQEGVKTMSLAKGDPFDSEYCEAITKMPTTHEEMKGKVLEVTTKGYLLNGKVLRFAKVVIGE